MVNPADANRQNTVGCKPYVSQMSDIIYTLNKMSLQYPSLLLRTVLRSFFSHEFPSRLNIAHSILGKLLSRPIQDKA